MTKLYHTCNQQNVPSGSQGMVRTQWRWSGPRSL